MYGICIKPHLFGLIYTHFYTSCTPIAPPNEWGIIMLKTQQNITESLIKKLKPSGSRYDVRDGSLKGFMIRVTPTGTMSYTVEYSRGKKRHIGRVGVIELEAARKEAIRIRTFGPCNKLLMKYTSHPV